ncbi:hypothetical protein LCGC14_2825380 [marine sediment metagenome]|uniref:Helix-turn-helix domain-containing protein n=1 Tax=marine sediment metagenome TaxID=412755 RepID=A0A0F8Z2G4_9ZZZZ
MSVSVMTLVWRSDLPANHKLVLLAYADHANDDGSSVYPGEDWMAAKTSYTGGNIRRVTKELVEAGFLHRVKRGQTGQRAEWEVDVPKLRAAQSARLLELEAARREAKSRANDGKEARGTATPNVIEPSVEPSVQIAATPRNPWWDITVELFGEPAEGQRSLYGRFIAMASAGDKPPPQYGSDEIRRRAGLLAELWGVKAVTVASLEKHWSRFDAAIGKVSDEDVEAFTDAQDKAAMLERLADE